MRSLFALAAGALFGAGLFVSGMTDTRKVQGWLDVFGDWDPTLAFVLGGAIVPMFFAWRIAERRTAPVTGGTFPAKPTGGITADLAIGSLIFGMGWGLAGLCPGPSFASLSFGGWQGLTFARSAPTTWRAWPTPGSPTSSATVPTRNCPTARARARWRRGPRRWDWLSTTCRSTPAGQWNGPRTASPR